MNRTAFVNGCTGRDDLRVLPVSMIWSAGAVRSSGAESDRMRILMLSWEYPPYVVGGMGKHVAELVPMLGCQVTAAEPLFVDVVTTRYAGGPGVEQLNEHVRIFRVDTLPLDPLDHYNSVVANNQFLVEKADALHAEAPYAMIHAHDWLVGDAGIQLKHRWRRPLLTTIHATERGRHQGNTPGDASRQIDRMEWLACFEAWRVIACSDYMRNELVHYFGLPRAKVDVIPNGINLESAYACSEEERAALRARYSPNGEKLLLYVGRIVYEKGLHVLIRAMPRILADHPNTRLLVVGKNGQQHLPLATQLEVADQIEFLGFVPDSERDCLYRIADAAVFPSIYEPFGIVALEAMGLDCNVIASSVGGLAEVIQHDVNGLNVFPDNPLSIAWAVNELFADEGAAARRRQVAMEQVSSVYNWNTIARQTAEVYQTVVGERLETNW